MKSNISASKQEASIELGKKTNPKTLASDIDQTIETLKRELGTFSSHTLTIEQAEQIKFRLGLKRKNQLCLIDTEN